MRSLSDSSPAGIATSAPSRRIVASFAPTSSSARTADPASRLERASIQRPSSRKATTPAAASK